MSNPLSQNQLTSPRQYAGTLAELFSTPTQWFTLTNRCNINCHYCYNYQTQDNEDMSPDVALGILKYYLKFQEQHGIKHPYLNILFLGGEPSLNTDALFAIMDFLNQNDIKCLPKIFTNGLINEATLNELLKRALFFQISFDGFINNLRLTKSGKDNIHPQLIRTIKQIQAADQPIQLRATIHAANATHMSEIVRFAAEHNISSVAFYPVFPDGNAKKYQIQRPSVEAYVAHYEEAFNLAREHDITINGGEFHIRKSLQEGKLHFPLVWLPDGHLSTTIAYASDKTPEAHKALIGRYSLTEDKIFIDEEKLNQMRIKFDTRRAKDCAGCVIYNSCQGTLNLDNYTLDREISPVTLYSCEISRNLLSNPLYVQNAQCSAE